MSRVHISIPVRDLERSVDFYGRLFGTGPSKRRDDYANFRLDEPPIHLAMVAGEPARASAGPQHFGVEVPDAAVLEAWRRRSDDRALGATEEPGARCCYAQADKLWLTDPDGYRWEIWVRTGEHDALGD